MKSFWIVGIGLLPLVAGCSVFETNPVPPNPALTGVSAQDAAWKDQIKQVRGGDGARFEPLEDARDALARASAEQGVENYDAQALASARQALDAAESGWAEVADKRRPSRDRLAEIASDAHRAQRLAEIARYTAIREINLEKLVAANDELQSREPVQQPAGEARPVTGAARELVGQKVVPDRLGEVSFQPGTARMKAESQAVVGELAQLLSQYPSVGVAIFGHTDNVGPSAQSLERFVAANPRLEQQAPSRAEKVRAFNLALSAARARAVAQLLVENGVPARRIGARGFGDTRPVASNDTEAGRQANRRIEAVIVPGPDSPEAQQARANAGS